MMLCVFIALPYGYTKPSFRGSAHENGRTQRTPRTPPRAEPARPRKAPTSAMHHQSFKLVCHASYHPIRASCMRVLITARASHASYHPIRTLRGHADRLQLPPPRPHNALTSPPPGLSPRHSRQSQWHPHQSQRHPRQSQRHPHHSFQMGSKWSPPQ